MEVRTRVYHIDLGTFEDLDRECLGPPVDAKPIKKARRGHVLLELRLDETMSPNGDIDLYGVLCDLLRKLYGEENVDLEVRDEGAGHEDRLGGPCGEAFIAIAKVRGRRFAVKRQGERRWRVHGGFLQKERLVLVEADEELLRKLKPHGQAT